MTEREYQDVQNVIRLRSMQQVADGIFWIDQWDRLQRFKAILTQLDALAEELHAELAERTEVVE